MTILTWKFVREVIPWVRMKEFIIFQFLKFHKTIQKCISQWNFPVDASKLPKMICNTLRVYYSTDVVHAFSNFLKTKKVIFVDASFISLDKVTAAINGNAEQFGALEEIDITMKVNVKVRDF